MAAKLRLAHQSLPIDALAVADPRTVFDEPLDLVWSAATLRRAWRIWRDLSGVQRDGALRDVRRLEISSLVRKARRILAEALSQEQLTRRLPRLVDSSPGRGFDGSLTVVVTSYNYARYIRGCLASVLNSSHRNLAVLIVDPGSTDDVPGALGELLNDPRVTYVRRGERHLIGCNRNFGLMRSTTRYVAFVDADDEVYPEYLELATFAAELYGLDAVGSYLELLGSESGTWLGQPRFPDLSILAEANGLISHSVTRREALIAADGFVDSGLGASHVHEDWRLWHRMAALGGRFYNVTQRLVRYRIHEQSLSRSGEVRSHGQHAYDIQRANADVLPPIARDLRRQARATIKPQFGRTPQDATAPDRVLVILTPLLVLGGHLRMASHVARAAVDDGWTVYVCSTDESDDDLSGLRGWFPTTNCYFACLDRVLRRLDFPEWFAYLGSRASSLVVWDVGTPWLYGDHLPAICASADAVITTVVNETHLDLQSAAAGLLDAMVFERQDLAQLIPDTGRATAVIQNGVDPGQYRFRSVRRPGPLRVYWIGRLSEEKVPGDFLRLASQYQGPAADFVIVGSGPLERQVAAENIRGTNVVMRPAMTDIAPILQEADILVVTSRLEGRPNVILEAQASGAVVISTAVGGVPTMIEDKVTGFLVPPGDVAAMVERLTAAADQAIRAPIAYAARRYVEDSASSQAMAANYLDLFESLTVRVPAP